MSFKPIYRPFLKYLNQQPFNLQYFSKDQADAFRGIDLEKKFIIPLALNDYGKADSIASSEQVVFTAFGNIIESKNIPLLIEAGNRLWEKYKGRFKIRIVGQGKYWQECSHFIKEPQAFELDIRRISDREIPDLFVSSHYMVFPYKAVTQSGPLRIAYGYNIPVITSNLSGFKECMEENVTGFIFKSEDIESLVNIMATAINQHPIIYRKIKESQKIFIENNLSTDSILQQYVNMLDKILMK